MLNASVAAVKFGLGPKQGEIRSISNPRSWLIGQLRIAPGPAGRHTGEILQELLPRREMSDAFRQTVKEVLVAEATARTEHQIRTDTPFLERWVAFFSNHLCVSGTRTAARPLLGAYEREAIRPNVLGAFEDLLIASVQHPAMLLYLDNVRSLGPNSLVGKRRGRGLNENLAREILELHTLGVDGGYTQQDVGSLAQMLTGWSVSPSTGAFTFDEARHEPGARSFLGHSYPGWGREDGLAALTDLARHPATARHLARKLAIHFVSDDPSPAAVDFIMQAFLQSRGNLRETAIAVIDCPDAHIPGSKLKSPWELVISVGRALGSEAQIPALLASQRRLGQMPWMPPSPQGWPDTEPDWLAPEALLRRLEWVEQVGHRAARTFRDPVVLAQDVLGSYLSERTRAMILDAETPSLGLSLLLASPEFQRR